MVDTKGYALVKSDVATNRLNLRTAPSKDAASIGKYYSGTPVRILSEEDEWCKVSVFGVEGYFMRKYLAFDQAMLSVPRYFLSKYIKDDQRGSGIPVYQKPDTQSGVNGTLPGDGGAGYSTEILGVAGDDWYHVVCGNGLCGYVEAKYYWDGNG